LAAALWPLPEIAERHERLAGFAEACLARLQAGPELTGVEQLTMAVELAAEFGRAMKPDPLLPPELLPRPWPGGRARRLTADCWTRLRRAGPADGTPAPRLFALYADALRAADED
jgi:phenylacetic acid degradation operon negative regulatory protein